MNDIFDGRPKQIDYPQRDRLHYLGNYIRKLPVGMARMMENALDWEHLPFVHSSSFASMQEVESGPWGWRAEATLPAAAGGQAQMLELLLDSERHYWATATLSGPGTGMQIHTQASEISDGEIEVDVRFYLPEPPAGEEQGAQVLAYMQALYARLYDEDQELMTGRQAALDRRAAAARGNATGQEIAIGPVAEISASLPHMVDTEKGQICIRRHAGEWAAHGAQCPHLLGPLENSEIDGEGALACPWHGYRFNIADGRNLDGKCAALRIWSDALYEKDGILMLRLSGA